MASNSAVTVTLAAGIVKLVPLIAWFYVPSLYFRLPAFNRLPVSGVMVRVMVSTDDAVVGEAEMLPPAIVQ